MAGERPSRPVRPLPREAPRAAAPGDEAMTMPLLRPRSPSDQRRQQPQCARHGELGGWSLIRRQRDASVAGSRATHFLLVTDSASLPLGLGAYSPLAGGAGSG